MFWNQIKLLIITSFNTGWINEIYLTNNVNSVCKLLDIETIPIKKRINVSEDQTVKDEKVNTFVLKEINGKLTDSQVNIFKDYTREKFKDIWKCWNSKVFSYNSLYKECSELDNSLASAITITYGRDHINHLNLSLFVKSVTITITNNFDACQKSVEFLKKSCKYMIDNAEKTHEIVLNINEWVKHINNIYEKQNYKDSLLTEYTGNTHTCIFTGEDSLDIYNIDNYKYVYISYTNPQLHLLTKNELKELLETIGETTSNELNELKTKIVNCITTDKTD